MTQPEPKYQLIAKLATELLSISIKDPRWSLLTEDQKRIEIEGSIELALFITMRSAQLYENTVREERTQSDELPPCNPDTWVRL